MADGRRCILLVGNPAKGGMEAVTQEERAQWERFADESGWRGNRTDLLRSIMTEWWNELKYRLSLSWGG